MGLGSYETLGERKLGSGSTEFDTTYMASTSSLDALTSGGLISDG